MQRHLYPDEWELIAEEVKRDAGYRCERCGSPSVAGRILTVHHLDMNPANCDLKNLVALCQVCHLHVQARYIVGQQTLFEKPDWMHKRGL